jgi:AcrR family transcriptional regulator/DNA-binding MarR family transcriptional regulator
MALAYPEPALNRPLRRVPTTRSRAQVLELQRDRLITATLQAIEQEGYARLTVGRITSRARVSRKTFYDVFLDREDGFLAAFERAVAGAREAAREAYDAEATWRDGIRAGLQRLLILIDSQPGVARVCVVESLAAGDRVRQARAEMLHDFAQAVDRGRATLTGAHTPPPVTAEAVVGGIVALLYTRLLEGGEQPLTDLLGAMMSLITLPYLGAGVARKELQRPCSPPRENRPSQEKSQADPLEGLGMRLTYRTIRVLMAIAARPGASNRDIAADADVVDEGQVSKLLHRLARLGLIENYGAGQSHGAPNSWRLTARGAQIERATRPALKQQAR